MHEHVVPVDDEGVEVAVVDEVNADALRAEPGGAEDRFGVVADQRFRLGIADQALGLGRGRGEEGGSQSADETRAQPPRGGFGSG